MADGLLMCPRMEWLLRRNYWLVKLTGVMVVAAFLAHTATTMLSLWLFRTVSDIADAAPDVLDDDATDVPTLADASPAWRRDPEKIAARILGYDAFCPACEPETGVAAPVRAPDGSFDFDGARRSTLPLQVAATMEAEDPTRSLATIRQTDGGYAGLFTVGDALAPGVQIVAIASGRVDILNGATPEFIPVGEAPPAPKAHSEPRPAPAEPGASESRAPPGAEDAIKCEGSSCQVERKFVEGLIASPAQLVGQGLAAPAKTKAGEDGFRIRGVRRGTLPDLLGLKNGDIITEVAGKPLTMDSMLALSQQIRSARHIEVVIDRRGTKVTKALELV